MYILLPISILPMYQYIFWGKAGQSEGSSLLLSAIAFGQDLFYTSGGKQHRHNVQRDRRMARRQPPLRTRRNPSFPTRPPISSSSGIVGAILLALAALWMIWLLVHQLAGSALSVIPIIGFPPATPSTTQLSPLVAEGITIGHTDATPTLNKQQALVIASQLQPDAAARAKVTNAQYVLVTYPNKSTPATHVDLNNTAAWMIHYQKIPLSAPDPAIDPKPLARTSYDLYVFLDANSGKELLVVQV